MEVYFIKLSIDKTIVYNHFFVVKIDTRPTVNIDTKQTS